LLDAQSDGKEQFWMYSQMEGNSSGCTVRWKETVLDAQSDGKN